MSKKRLITLSIIALVIAGMIWAGGLFELIDVIIVRPIVNILFVIYNLVKDFGLAIILFTILVKLLMWPLVKKQLHQTKLMKKLQPELAEIKKRCNGNRQLESLQTMDLYKKYNAKPFSSILTLIIQLPIFIALFSAIKVIATPIPTDNLSNRAYEIVAYEGSQIAEVKEKQKAYLDDLANNDIPAEEKTPYDFHPQLFGVINLEAKASDVITPNFSWSAVFMLGCSICASFVQYWIAKQQMPKNDKKKKTFRQLIKEAEKGEELKPEDVTALSTGSMSKMMPFMMFLIMFNLNGALAFYYLLNNLLTILQQRIVLHKAEDTMDNIADKAVLKELKNIKEAQIIENKKTGTKITRISAKDNKKKRR